MFCRKCGNGIPEDSEFCPKCGIKIKLEADSSETLNYETELPVQNGTVKSKKKKIMPIILILLSVTVIAAVVLMIAFYPVYSTLHNEFSYIIDGDKFVVITGYSGGDTDVVIPEIIKGMPVKVIVGNAFRESNITSVKLNEGLVLIGPGAFENCTSLQTVTTTGISTLSSINDSAFAGCTSLRTIGDGIIPQNGCIEVGEKAFYNCRSLSSIPFEGELSPMGVSAFENCTSLENVSLYSAAISPRCFVNCISLTTVECRNGGGIGYEAFLGCEKLSAITVNGNEYNTPDDLQKLGRIICGRDAFLNCAMFMDNNSEAESNSTTQHHDVSGTTFMGKNISDVKQHYKYNYTTNPWNDRYIVVENGELEVFSPNYSDFDIITVTSVGGNCYLSSDLGKTDFVRVGMTVSEVFNILGETEIRMEEGTFIQYEMYGYMFILSISEIGNPQIVTSAYIQKLK